MPIEQVEDPNDQGLAAQPIYSLRTTQGGDPAACTLETAVPLRIPFRSVPPPNKHCGKPIEPPAQTAKEAAGGDVVASRLLANKAAEKKP
jgi:hypothetical protein